MDPEGISHTKQRTAIKDLTLADFIFMKVLKCYKATEIVTHKRP